MYMYTGWQGKRVSLLYQMAFCVSMKSYQINVNIALVYYIAQSSCVYNIAPGGPNFGIQCIEGH